MELSIKFPNKHRGYRIDWQGCIFRSWGKRCLKLESTAIIIYTNWKNIQSKIIFMKIPDAQVTHYFNSQDSTLLLSEA